MSRTRFALPVPGPPPPLRVPQATRIRLDNGLVLRSIHRDRLPIVDTLLVLPAGASADPPGRAGQASLLAELLDAGTATRSQAEIARALDTLGARVSIHADWDFSALSLQVLPDRLHDALAVVADLVRNATFPGPEFERGRAERLAAILQDLEDPDALAASAIARAIHGADHVYGTPRHGSRSTVENIERAALVQCHHARYRAAGATLVMAGDVTTEAAEREATDAFGDWVPGPGPAAESLPAAVRGPTGIRMIDRPGAPQSEVRIGTVGAARTSRDYFPLVVLNTILGGSFTSRLNTRLRERGGYTYGAFSAFSFRRHAGPFVAGAAVFADATARAVAATLDEIERIGVERVPPDELDRAKRYLTLGMARAFESNGSTAARVAETELHGLGDDWWERYAERIDAIDAEAVRVAARSYLDPAKLAIVVVGDMNRTRSALEALEVGPIIEDAVE